VPEWPIGHAWKACEPQGSEGSNPSLSAKQTQHLCWVFLFGQIRARSKMPSGQKNQNGESHGIALQGPPLRDHGAQRRNPVDKSELARRCRLDNQIILIAHATASSSHSENFALFVHVRTLVFSPLSKVLALVRAWRTSDIFQNHPSHSQRTLMYCRPLPARACSLCTCFTHLLFRSKRNTCYGEEMF
jgi:hypothetical protein